MSLTSESILSLKLDEPALMRLPMPSFAPPAPPPGLEAPPGLEHLHGCCSSPPGLVQQAAADVPKAQAAKAQGEAYQVKITGLSDLMMNEAMIETMLEQAGLEEGIKKVSTKGSHVLLSFSSLKWVSPCVRHFNGRPWGKNGVPVIAVDVSVLEPKKQEEFVLKAKVVSSLEPVFITPSSFSKMSAFSANAPVFVPLSTLSSEAATFVPASIKIQTARYRTGKKSEKTSDSEDTEASTADSDSGNEGLRA
jgi:hypothetical protein